SRSSGAPNVERARGPCERAHAGVQGEQQFGRRPVGAMHGETPRSQVGGGADGVAVARDQAVIVATPGFGAAGGDTAGALRLDELDTSGIREALLGRIDDL